MVKTKIIIPPSVGYRDLKYTMLVVDTFRGEIYQFTDVARTIWIAITSNCTRKEVVEKVTNDYLANINDVEKDTAVFIKQLKDEGIIDYE